MKHRACTCRDCKHMRRRGKILGTYTRKHFAGMVLGNIWLRVSDYVPHPKFQKGKRVRRGKVDHE